MPQISFLILTYNSSRHIENCLASLFNNLNTNTTEVLIADNNSADETEKIVKKAIAGRKNTEYFQTGENLGYAKGINFLASKADGEVLIIINPDSEVIEADFAKIYKKIKSSDDIGIVGMKMIKGDGTTEKSAGHFYNFFTILLFGFGVENLFGVRFSQEREMKVDYVSGGFIAIKKEVFEKLNGYSETYFMYLEDMDLCFRAREMGFSTHFMPYATIKHLGQGSSNKEFAILNIYKGYINFYRRNKGFLEFLYVRNILFFKSLLVIFVSSVTGNKEQLNIYKKTLNIL